MTVPVSPRPLRALLVEGVHPIAADLLAATAHGVAVFNAPFSNTRSVVELAVAEIIALTRRLTVHDDAMHTGIWRKSAKGSHEVRGRRLGIVGYGKIGSQLSVLAEALGMRVSFFDTADRLALGNARRCATLDELLADSDVVSLHVDGRPGNSGMFGAEQFAAMAPGAAAPQPAGHARLRQRPARRRRPERRAAGVRHLGVGRLRGHRRARPASPGRGRPAARHARDHPGPRAVRPGVVSRTGPSRPASRAQPLPAPAGS